MLSRAGVPTFFEIKHALIWTFYKGVNFSGLTKNLYFYKIIEY